MPSRGGGGKVGCRELLQVQLDHHVLGDLHVVWRALSSIAAGAIALSSHVGHAAL